jgi:hypothetical protein
MVQLQIEITESEADEKGWTVAVSHEGKEVVRCDEVYAKRVGSIRYLPVYVAAESLPKGFYTVQIQSAGRAHNDEIRTLIIQRALSQGVKGIGR